MTAPEPGGLHRRRDLDRMLREQERQVAAAQEVADLFNKLNAEGLVVTLEGLDVVVPGNPVVGSVFLTDGGWRTARNG